MLYKCNKEIHQKNKYTLLGHNNALKNGKIMEKIYYLWLKHFIKLNENLNIVFYFIIIFLYFQT